MSKLNKNSMLLEDIINNIDKSNKNKSRIHFESIAKELGYNLEIDEKKNTELFCYTLCSKLENNKLYSIKVFFLSDEFVFFYLLDKLNNQYNWASLKSQQDVLQYLFKITKVKNLKLKIVDEKTDMRTLIESFI